MSVSLSAERDRIQRQVEQLEQSLSATHTELELLSSETDDESDGDDAEEERQCAAGLLAQREKIKNEIQNLEEVLGPHSPVCVSDDDDGSSSSSEESELGLSPSADSCLQMNLVYQQVVQETLDQLETLLTNNHRQQKELVTQLSGPIRESPRERPAHPSCQLPITMYLGRFLKPYFKDKLTGLGPPANQETKEKANRMTGCLDDKKLKVKRWESWQKTLLIHSVTRDGLRRLIQPKLSKVDYLSQKLSRAAETDKQQLRQQITSLERDIELLRMKKDNELVGGRYDEHDWQKISNIDFEGTREAEDISRFWQNFLHPSVSKEKWSQDEVQRLKEVSRRHGERHWDAIAAELGTGRTAFLCLQTFQRYVSDSLKRGVWSPDEDALLRELVDKMRIGNFIPYTQMSYFMEGRDPAQLIYRWNQVLDPSLKKGSWTKEEDQLLLRAVSLFGEKDWWKIRFEVPGRTDCSCRDRYYDCLKAETKRGRFDQQEKQLLQLLVEKHGVGRWAKIASEIPLRYDAQCLREWRIMSRPPRPPKAKTTTKTSGGKKKKATPPSKKRKRRRVIVKEESSEEEEEEVQYMDSDEEKKTMIKEEVVQSTEEEEEEEEPEEEYIIPCMQDWVPAEKAHGFTSLSFRPVALPSSSGLARDQTPVRSTILGPFGRSVVLGPEPRELSRTERHGSVMMMVSPDQLRAHLQRQVSKYDARGAAPPRKIQTDRRSPLGRATDPGLVYELQAAVTPWIGNVLIPQVHRAAAAEALGPQGAGAQPLSSTQVFLLLLQTMSVDTAGCKDVIQQRRKRVLVLEPPAPAPVPSSRLHNSVAELLRQKRLLKDEQILNQLQMLQQLPPLRRPGVLLQMPPIMRPRMSSMSFPRAVFLPHPVSQPLSSSIGPMNPCRPLPLGVLSSVVPETLKATSTCSAASHQKAQPLTQNLMVALPCSTHPGPIPTHPAPAPTHPGPIPTHPGPILTHPGPAPTHPCPALTHPGPAPSHPGPILTLPGSAPTHPGPILTHPGPAPTHPGPILTHPGPILTHPGPAPTHPGPAPTHPGPIPTHPAPAPTHPGPIPTHPGPILTLPGSAPTHPGPILTHPGPAPTHPGPAPTHPGPILTHPGPILTHPGPAPTHPGPILTHPGPVLTHPGPAPSLPGPAPTHPGPILTHPGPILTHPGPAPTHPGPILTLPGPAPSLPGPAPTHPGPILTHPGPAPTHPGPILTLPGPAPSHPCTGAGADVGGAGADVGGAGADVGGASDGLIEEQSGRRLRKPSLKAREVDANKKAASSPLKRTQIQTSIQPSPGSPSMPSPQRLASSAPSSLATFLNDHHYASFGPRPGPVGSDLLTPPPDATPPKAPPKAPRRRRTRAEEQPDRCVIEKVQNPTERARPLQESKAETKKKKRTSPLKKRSRSSFPKREVVIRKQPMAPLPGFCLLPGQSMWVMTPGGLVQLAQAPPQGLQLTLVPSAALPAPLVCPLAAVSVPARPPQPKSFKPYKGAPRAPPLALQFDPSLMFLEPREAVCDWLSGRRGVAVPGAAVALPYLPPFVGSLNALGALLRSKTSLTRCSLKLLARGSEPQLPPTKPSPPGKRTSRQPPDLPDSTSDFGPPRHTPAPSVSPEEEELVQVLRQLVAERFSGNPAYQLLKARFLSCFTVPALLATVQPIREKTVTCTTNEEEEAEREGEELKKIKERGRQRRAERSLLLCDGSGAPANHFSGIHSAGAPLCP
ncbi:snRNA-activating protein complex subunit 4 [Clinocottus analis]|uniref:snRNA-activating protein complex subunit 4 n=1 Tax=Clinocottus analis TaxID=304258 RepID=UPI0035C0A140